MSTSSQSFEQVRSILSKLDRDIEAARAKRLNRGGVTRSEPRPADTPPLLPTPPERDSADRSQQLGRSGYGIARPLRRDS